jgi:hypothetical protein
MSPTRRVGEMAMQCSAYKITLRRVGFMQYFLLYIWFVLVDFTDVFFLVVGKLRARYADSHAPSSLFTTLQKALSIPSP